MQKWEYCMIGPIKSTITGPEGYYPYTVHLTDKGLAKTRIEGAGILSEISILAQTVAKLGEEGWEMVGCGNTGDSHYLYFKRIKE